MIKIPGRIPIRIHPLFFLMAGVIGYLNSGTLEGASLWFVIIVISVLIHELGHAFTAILFGQKVRIDFVALGGITSRTGDQDIKLWKEFFIVLNGPLAGLGLAFLFMFLLPLFAAHTVMYTAFQIGMYVNFFWTFANLLPVQPLDGGHLLRIILEGAFGYRGVKVAAMLSLLFAVTAAALFFLMGAMLPGVLFVLFAFEGWRMWQMSYVMTAPDRQEQYRSLLRQGEKLLAHGKIEEGMQELEKVRQETKAGLLYLVATQQMAKIYYQRKDYEAVYLLLEGHDKELDYEMRYILYDAAYHTRRWAVVSKLGNELYTVFPSDSCALMNAEAHAALGEIEPAIGWLNCAVSEGAANISTFVQRPAFDKIRNDPIFRREFDASL